MGANLFCWDWVYEQMRSIVNLKRPVLLGRAKPVLRILVRKPVGFSEPFSKISSKGVKSLWLRRS